MPRSGAWGSGEGHSQTWGCDRVRRSRPRRVVGQTEGRRSRGHSNSNREHGQDHVQFELAPALASLRSRLDRAWQVGKALVERAAEAPIGERDELLQLAEVWDVPPTRSERASRADYQAALDRAVADAPEHRERRRPVAKQAVVPLARPSPRCSTVISRHNSPYRKSSRSRRACNEQRHDVASPDGLDGTPPYE